jgi:methylthioribose-1-phosphate isomerase
MRINGRSFRTIWPTSDGRVEVIDQTRLPHQFEIVSLGNLEDVAQAIRNMVVRGAPLLGATAAYGLALSLRTDSSDSALEAAVAHLLATRPTAANLRWALDRVRRIVAGSPRDSRASLAWMEAAAICDEDVTMCRRIGEHGLGLLREISSRIAGPVNILTHCNAGWLACVDWGTALAPVYLAHEHGIPVHVWVGETRPRNQGASLTAFELGGHGVPYTVIADNAAGHLMQLGRIQLCLVGADRVTSQGNAANKIGTYLQALAAQDTGTPFYVAVPSSSIDWTLDSGAQIPIEERSSTEVTHMTGRLADGALATVEITAPDSPAFNPAFDVTPARLITGFITERGIATPSGLRGMFPETFQTRTP